MKKLLILILAISFSFCNAQEVKKEQLKDAVLASGKLFRVDSFPSKFITPRPVDIWLPENYSEEKKYAVLYMHDGQNLFDATTTWNKQEWKVDEHAEKLMKDSSVKDFIVVGIHNIPSMRWLDLFPQKAIDFVDKEVKEQLFKEAEKNNFKLNFKGDDYLSFLVKEVKPYLDANYSTKTDKANTFVAGSSMGGLMSMYAVAEYPEIFGGAACLSTHWVGAMVRENNPLPDAIFSYLKVNMPAPKDHKMYFDYGNKTLDQYYPQYAPKVDAVFKEAGYTDKNFKNLFFENTDHSEKSWNQRFDQPLTFLLAN